MVRTHRILALALVLTLLLPASAFAGVVREYQLQYAPTGDATGALMIVSALVDPQTPLPAVVTVPVPTGATVLWAGEVLGADPSADPARDTTVETIDGMDVYTLTLQQAYTAQVEIQLPLPTVSGSKVEGSVDWTNPGDEVLVTASVIAEPGATDVKTTPKVAGETRTNDAGETLYPLTGRRVATGDTFTVDAEWQRGGEAAASDSSSLLPVLLGALVFAILALVVVVTRERTRARRASAPADQ